MPDRVLYRIVKSNPPTDEQFASLEAQGRSPPPDDPDAAHRWDGISAYDSAKAARRLAQNRSRLGRFVAELRIPEAAPVRCEKTGGPGHYTRWGEADMLLGCVVSVTPA